MFFARMQMAFVFEALGIIREIRDSESLMAEVEKCESKTQGCFAKVRRFLDSKDYALMAQIRNNAGFHYDAKRAERAVQEIAAERPDDLSALTLGHDPLDWYFELADRVHEKVVVRYIFEVPKGADIGKESDVIAGRIFDMAEALGEFAGYFVWEQTN